MISDGARSAGSADQTDDSDDRASLHPAHELADRRHRASTDAADDGDDQAGPQPECEFIDHSAPPPDDKVIAREEAKQHGRQRSLLLRTFIGVLVMVIIADIVLGSFLPSNAWAQVKPDIEDIRKTLFYILLIVIGYYFGDKKSR